jgi:ribosomal-protein-alanine N-acetyltransferase
VRGPFQSAFLGYWVGATFRRQGYMREGLPLVLKRAFGALALHRVEANIQPHNAPSLALVKGAGFRFEGLAHRYLKIAGRWRDHEHWVILAEDWRAAHRRR